MARALDQWFSWGLPLSFRSCGSDSGSEVASLVWVEKEEGCVGLGFGSGMAEARVVRWLETLKVVEGNISEIFFLVSLEMFGYPENFDPEIATEMEFFLYLLIYNLY